MATVSSSVRFKLAVKTIFPSPVFSKYKASPSPPSPIGGVADGFSNSPILESIPASVKAWSMVLKRGALPGSPASLNQPLLGLSSTDQEVNAPD